MRDVGVENKTEGWGNGKRNRWRVMDRGSGNESEVCGVESKSKGWGNGE